MRWLKSLVIVLGLLIVLGVLLLGFGFYKKTTDPDWNLFGGIAVSPPIGQAVVNAPPAAALGPVKPNREPLTAFGTISLNLPAGCVITRFEPRRQYAYLEIGPTPECNRIVLVDLKRGVILGAIKP